MTDVAASEADVAAHLLERLLAEPDFRARFRRDPAAACREAGLDQLADEMALGAGKAMMTLDIRESKSSLAGVLMAAAMEGVGLYQLSEHVFPHLDDVPAEVGDVLSRVHLPSIKGALAGSPGVPDAPEPQASGGDATALAEPPSKGSAAPPEAKGSAAPPEAPDPKPSPRDDASAAPPEAGSKAEPSPPREPPPVETAPAADVDPSQLGAEGTGGPPTPETEALLNNDNVTFDQDGIADLKAGRIDPRVVAVLTKLSQDHKITVSCMCSDHSKFTTGGSVSNHHFGRGVDIAAIDGVPVNASNFDAREIAMELQDLDSSIRPNEIGTPWAIAGPGYFTDGAHQNHLHIGFKQAITPDFKPPADLAAPGDVPVATAPSATGGGSLGPAALRIAQTQRGVREIGSTNTGPQVDEFLAAAGVAPGNPWCASFVTWSLEQAGHKMPGSGWAAVSTWVRNAEQGSNGLKIVSPEEARPGDIVAYDWGGQSDFGADGHIGFLDSTVQGGKFTALEGNNADAVNVVPRQLGGGANIVFIRAEGDAAGGALPDAKVAPAKADTLTIPAAPEAKAAAAGTAPAKADTLSLPVAEPQTTGPAADEFTPRDYPGDNASKAELAAWMASEAKKRGLPPELPVMASLVESGLANLNFGDRDSVGFFQMRTEIWNSGPYAGYPDDPQKQIDWFLDHAEAVKAKRQAAGLPIDDPNQYGDWIADVELPAEQFRGRYQLKLADAQNLLEQAPAAPAPEDVLDAAAGGAGGGAAGAKALAAVAEAKKYLGTPYQWGGSTPQTNFDCSGLVQWSYAQAGISIPRVTYDQIDAPNGTPVSRDKLLPGDLVFFADGGDVHHVGMSLGGDKFIHAPHTGDVVKISSLNEPYYAQQFAGGRRFDAAGSAPAPDPTDVAKAQAHVAVDAAEVRRHDSLLFKAIQVQEARKSRSTVQFLKAIDPSQVQPTKDGAPAAPPELAAEAPVAPAAPVDLAGVSRDYPGDDAPKAELARWLAKQAEKAGLPPELPVMASLVESGVQNLNYGDRDSVGFFQMRTEIWNSGPYAGYPERPELQAKWFIDNALAVKRKRIAAGDVNFGKDPSKWGEWIADVERPAEQYRGRYQLRLGEARSLLR